MGKNLRFYPCSKFAVTVYTLTIHDLVCADVIRKCNGFRHNPTHVNNA